MTDDGHGTLLSKPPGPAASSAGRSVLVVDDDPAARDWFRRVFGRAGYRVTVVDTVGAATSPLATDRPDLVVCDVQLPDESGLTLTARLRADRRTADIPVLQVSAVHISPPDRVAGLASGADAYLTGPLDAAEVLAVAEALLRARAAEHERGAALERLSRLQAATAALARAGTPEDVLTYLAAALRGSFGITGLGLGLLDEAGTSLDLLMDERPASFPAAWPVDDDTPFGRAVREQAAVVLGSQRERRQRFPRIAELVTRTEASVDLPLCTSDGQPLGVLGIGFPTADTLDEELVRDLRSIAELTGQVVHRARLEAAERRSRRRLQLLQDLTGALSRAADERAVAGTALRYATSAFGADDAALLRRTDGRTEVLAVTRGSAGRLPTGWPAAGDLVTGREVVAGAAAGGHGSVISFPLPLTGRRVGALCLALRDGAAMGVEERTLARAIAEHTAEALVRAGAAEQERVAFLELQQRLLPPVLPEHADWELVGRYRPAADGSAVGGDWYDVVDQPSGRLTLVIGDVAGHGTSASALMSELRHTLHAHLSLDMPVEDAVSRVNRAPGLRRAAVFATLLLADIDPAAGGLTLLSAGHPPALLMTRDGATRMLDAPPNRALGVTEDWAFRSTSLFLPAGGTLLLYTDGLVERRDTDLDAGLRRLREVMPLERDLDATADELLARCVGTDDDTAVVLARHRK